MALHLYVWFDGQCNLLKMGSVVIDALEPQLQAIFLLSSITILLQRSQHFCRHLWISVEQLELFGRSSVFSIVLLRDNWLLPRLWHLSDSHFDHRTRKKLPKKDNASSIQQPHRLAERLHFTSHVGLVVAQTRL